MEKKKRNMLLLVLVVIIILAILFASAMTVQSEIVLTDGTVIPQSVCEAKGIADKVVVMHSPGCSACNIAVPRLEELEDEMDVEFEFIDVSSDSKRLVQLGLMPTKIPTIIIGCKTYIGVKTKEDYRSLIEG